MRARGIMAGFLLRKVSVGEGSSGSIKEDVLWPLSRRGVLNLILCDGSSACHPALLEILYKWLDQAPEFFGGFRAVRTGDWGEGATSWGHGRMLPVALETGLGTGKCRLVRLPKFVLLSSLSTLAPITRQCWDWMCAPHVLWSPILPDPFWKGSLDTFSGPGC